jgi:hypothetical protein
MRSAGRLRMPVEVLGSYSVVQRIVLGPGDRLFDAGKEIVKQLLGLRAGDVRSSAIDRCHGNLCAHEDAGGIGEVFADGHRSSPRQLYFPSQPNSSRARCCAHASLAILGRDRAYNGVRVDMGRINPRPGCERGRQDPKSSPASLGGQQRQSSLSLCGLTRSCSHPVGKQLPLLARAVNDRVYSQSSICCDFLARRLITPASRMQRLKYLS